MQAVIQAFKVAWLYVFEIGVSVLCFSLLFFMYAKYKTGKNFKELLQMYFAIIATACFLTGLILSTVFVLIHYIPIFHIVVFLLSASSISILLKHLFIGLNKKAIIFDIGIVFANAYCSYVLVMQERLDIYHYLLLGSVVFCFFLYQQIKKVS